MEKLSQAFIPLLDESQVVQVTRELQNIGQRAATKLRQARVFFVGGLDFAPFLHNQLVEYVLTSMLWCWVATNRAMLLLYQKQEQLWERPHLLMVEVNILFIHHK